MLGSSDRKLDEGRVRARAATLIVVALLAAVLAGSLASPAGAQAPSGSISGRVTNTSNVALQGVCVRVYHAIWEELAGSAKTDATGSYAVTGLPNGSYSVEFSPCDATGYLPQWWSEESAFYWADDVVLSSEIPARTGINGRLQQAASISGRVTNSVTRGPANACVIAESVSGGFGYGTGYGGDGFATTNPDGTYTINNLAAGSYEVYFYACDVESYIAQYYSGKATWLEADLVVVGAGESRTGIDAALHPGATISGRVTRPSGAPAVDVCVVTFRAGSTSSGAGGLSDSDGNYRITGLPAGQYKVMFTSCYGTVPYVTQFYAAKSGFETANTLTLAAGESRPGVDAQMQPAASISGRVVGPSGEIPTGHCAAAYTSSNTSAGTAGVNSTDGSYTITGLVAGSYKVRFYRCVSGSNVYEEQWYNGKSGWDSADAVVLTTGQERTGADATLRLAASIAGRVTGPGGAAVSGVCVWVTTAAPENRFAGSAAVDAAGDYKVGGLPAGSYKVEFYSCGPVSYLRQYYNDRPDLATADVITLTTGQARIGVNAQMDRAAQVSGRATGSAGTPLAGICVTAMSTTFGWGGSAQTDSSGAYTIQGLSPGTYKVKFYPCGSGDYLMQWYSQRTSWTSADSITVTANEVRTGVDAQLQSGGGRIAGRATSIVSGAGVANTCVFAYPTNDAVESVVSEARTDANGDYVLQGLRTGSYRVQFLDCGSGYLSQYYAGTTDYSAATLVSVTAPSSTNAINAVLRPNWDTVAPDTSISTEPAALTNSTTAQFAFASTELGSTFECKLDSGDWGSCSSPKSYTGLSQGSHTFAVRALDAVKNADPTPASHTWTVDTTPPDTTISAKPPAATNQTSASFSFSSSEANSTFECKLDSGTYGSCTSPRTHTGLAPGSHTFTVRATDAVGNVDATPTTHTWTVDTTPPDTSIPTKPGTLVNSATADFGLASTETGSTFECKLDSGTYGSCTSPKNYTGLAQGPHTFSVRATDAAGNIDATPATHTWTVDTIPPETSIGTKPAALVRSTAASFTFSSEAGATLECQLDSGGWGSCTSPKDYTALADGSHTFSVRARDTAGNTDPTPASHTWTVDTTPPDTTISAKPPAATNQTSASFSFSSSEANSTFECKLDSGTYGSCTSPKSYSGLAHGSHTFTVRATDPAGNVDATPATYTWTVDTTPPDTSIPTKPPVLANSATADFGLASTEAGSTFECKLDGGTYAACSSPKQYTGLSEGSHTVSVQAKDPAGNVDATPATHTWTVDTIPPETSIGTKPALLVKSTTADFSFSSPEAGATLECRLDGGAWAECTSPKQYTGLTDAHHTFDVRAVDRAGNADASPATHTWTVDTTPPQTNISAQPAALTNSTSASLTFASSETGSTIECKLDSGAWGSCTSPKSYTGLAQGPHTFSVRATDAIGNQDASPATHTWTVDTAAPDTSISTKPPAITASTAAEFTFGATENPSSFECKLDNGAYDVCTSPKSYTGLANGDHTFSVRATDGARNVDASPAAYSWTIDPTTNKPPTATVSVTPSSGVAPLATQVRIGGSDPEGAPLTYRLSFDDGTESTGSLPHGDVAHTFEEAGDHLVTLTVSDGRSTTTASARAVAGDPEPLAARAGDDQSVTTGTTVLFDGRDSRPTAGITSYEWDFGDGRTATGARSSRTYTKAGTYTVTLTVNRAGEEHSDTATVTVSDPVAEGLAVRVEAGGQPLPGAQALVVTSDGQRIQGVADGVGVARLRGLADGAYTVYGWASGHRPGTAAARVEGGNGSATVRLEAGSVGTAKLDTRRLDIEEIRSLGIDTSAPENQNVFEFEVWLGFKPGAEPIKLEGHVTGSGFHGASFSGSGSGSGSCSGSSCTTTADGRTFTGQLRWVGDQPTIVWMVIPVKGRVLKEFFEVSMVVENLASPAFTFTGGRANLQLPSGLSLAPTTGTQAASMTMPNIPGGASATQTWIVRGDTAGSYDLSADYSGVLNPISVPVSLQAKTAEPLKVWGVSALQLIVDAEDTAVRQSPYRVRVGIKNVADVPVYNPGVELLKEGKQNYIYQPLEKLAQDTAAIEPGDTWWTDDYVLLPNFSGRLSVSDSFVKQVGGDSGFAAQIVARNSAEPLKIEAKGLHNKLILSWDAAPGATGYQVFSTPDINTDFGDKPLPVRFLSPTKAVVDNVDPNDDARLYGVSTIASGKLTMVHSLTSVKSLDYAPSPRTSIEYEPPCVGTTATAHLTFAEDDWKLAQYEVDRGDGTTEKHALPGVQEMTVERAFDVTGSPTIRARAQNSDGDWGQWEPQKLEKCNYVALGDSFSSGEGNPLFDPKSRDCHRSFAGAYPQILQNRETMPEALQFWACSGAKTPAFDTSFKDEGPQLDHLADRTRLVTLTIGGNDTYFAPVVGACIGAGLASAVGSDLLGLDTFGLHIGAIVPACKPGLAPIVEAKLRKLDAGKDTPGSLADLYERVQNKAKNARVIVVGYPPLFPADRANDPCWGITAADVRWLASMQTRFNDVIERAAAEAHVEYVDPEAAFDGRDVCSSNPLINTPREMFNDGFHVEYGFHPNVAAQTKLADLVEQKYLRPPGTERVIQLGATQSWKVGVGAGVQLSSFKTTWPGSDVVMSLTSPSGRQITRSVNAPDVDHQLGNTFEVYDVKDPEPGEWTVSVYGRVVAAGGEEITFTSVDIPKPANVAPTAVFMRSTDLGEAPLVVDFDAGGSFDSEGGAIDYAWDFGDGTHGGGARPSHTYTAPGSYVPKLVVTDSAGAKDTFELAPVVVSAPGAAPPPGGGPDTGEDPPIDRGVPPDTVAPAISKLAASPSRFRVRTGKRGGTNFRFRLSEAANVTLSVERPNCSKRVRVCKRFKSVGKLVRGSLPGANSLPFNGKFGRRKLAVGRYRVVVTARDAAGNVSAAKVMTVTVVR